MNNSDDIFNILSSLDSRITKIEKTLGVEYDQTIPTSDEEDQESTQIGKSSFEQEFGINWLAKIGIIIFAIGLIFIISSSFSGLPTFAPSLLGFIFASLIFLITVYAKKWLVHLSNYFIFTAYILLFFSAIRLSHFSSTVFIQSNLLEILIQLLIFTILLIYSLKIKSIFLTSITFLFGYISTLLIDSSTYALILNLILSILIIILARKLNWPQIIIWGIMLTYTTFFIWFVGNPLLGESISEQSLPDESYLFILGVFLIYAIGMIERQKVEKEDFLKITSIFLNSTYGAISFLVLTSTQNREFISILSLISSIVFLLPAIISWFLERGKYSTFFYSIIGFMLLSVSIITGLDAPDYFIVLSWQSLLVVIAAIWFKSKIIIIANFIIYLIILTSFLFLSTVVTYISLSFGFVALLSARILNWKKKDLDLNSEGMRNAYLLCAFLIFPYTLFNSMPEGLITISWIGVAILYFVLSIVLHNVKYRWLATGTLLLSALYVIFFGASVMSPQLRIITFILLGIVLLVISIIYSKIRNESNRLLSENMKE